MKLESKRTNVHAIAQNAPNHGKLKVPFLCAAEAISKTKMKKLNMNRPYMFLSRYSLINTDVSDLTDIVRDT